MTLEIFAIFFWATFLACVQILQKSMFVEPGLSNSEPSETGVEGISHSDASIS